MRSVRKMVLGVAVGMCALSVLSAPAYAHHPKKEKEKHVFGKFVSTTTGVASGHGKVTAMSFGPYVFTGPELRETITNPTTHQPEVVPVKNKEGETEYGPLCAPINMAEYEEDRKNEKPGAAQDLKSSGEVKEGEHETFLQNLLMKRCITERPAGNGRQHSGGLLEEIEVKHLDIGLEFYSDHSAKFGEASSEAVLKPEGIVIFKAKGSFCEVEIEEQRVPIKAETKKGEEEEFEAALYSNEEEPTETKREMKKWGAIHSMLNIEAEFSKVKSDVPIQGKCFSASGGPEEKEFTKGVLDFELEEIGLKIGNLKFLPPATES